MNYIGKIDVNIYSCITEDITTDEVIITDRQIEHIKERHCGAFENIKPFLQDAVDNPDYILEDKGHNNTALILKKNRYRHIALSSRIEITHINLIK